MTRFRPPYPPEYDQVPPYACRDEDCRGWEGFDQHDQDGDREVCPYCGSTEWTRL